MNLTDAFQAWVAASARSPGTQRRYSIALKHMERHGIITISHVTRERIALYVLDRTVRDKITPSVANLELAALISVLKILEPLGLVSEELLCKLRRLRIRIRKNRRRRAQYLEVAQFQRLLSFLPPRAILPVYVAAYAGLRIGELCRLRWSDVDLVGRVIHVQIVEELGEFGRIKTGCGRKVPICDELLGAFAVYGVKGKTEFIFEAPQGGRHGPWAFIQPQSLRRDLRLAGRRSGNLSWVRYRTLRATRATWWAQGGVAPFVLAEWMGHTVEVCEQNYASVRPGYSKDAERMPAG